MNRRQKWALIRELTLYTRRDIAHFAVDEGYNPQDMTEYQHHKLMDIVLCNWARVNDYYQFWHDAYNDYLLGNFGAKEPQEWVEYCKNTKEN